MTKRKPSRGHAARQHRRAEEVRKQKAKQNTMIATIAGIVAVAVFAFLIWYAISSGGSNDGESEVIAGSDVVVEERPLDSVPPGGRDAYYRAYPDMVIDSDKSYEAIIEIEQGEIRLRLFPETAPLAVNNFVFLANEGFYDGLTFHRVLDGFMAQGGDPTGSGVGGPGYTFADETTPSVRFDKPGILAMANSGPATNGSQFFITFEATPWLDGGHTIFGEVIEGMNVLNSITRRDPQSSPDTAPDVIERITIIED